MSETVPIYFQQRVGNVLYCHSKTRLGKVVTPVPKSPYEALTIWTTIGLHQVSMFEESESYETTLATQRAKLQLMLYILNAINLIYIPSLPSPPSYSNMSPSETAVQPVHQPQT